MGEGFASVWDAIEDTPAAADKLKLRSALMIALKEQIERRRWTQAEAARRFGVGQPRVSDLMRGKIELFGLDTLVNMAVAAGLHVEMRVAERREPFHPALGRAFPAPGTASRAAAIRPPVDDSETATVSPRSFNRTPTVSAMEASVAMPPSSLALDSTVAMSVVARQILAYAHPWSGL